MALTLAALPAAPGALADADAPSYAVGGKYFDASDAPTYRVAPDGRVDWHTATGHDAYHRHCAACHGDRGAGSEYGTGLARADALPRYFDFVDATVNGQVVTSDGAARIMPAYGTSPSVICALDAIFVYLRAEAAGALEQVPPKHSAGLPPEALAEYQRCLQP